MLICYVQLTGWHNASYDITIYFYFVAIYVYTFACSLLFLIFLCCFSCKAVLLQFRYQTIFCFDISLTFRLVLFFFWSCFFYVWSFVSFVRFFFRFCFAFFVLACLFFLSFIWFFLLCFLLWYYRFFCLLKF